MLETGVPASPGGSRHGSELPPGRHRLPQAGGGVPQQPRPSSPPRTLDERKIWHRKLYEGGFLGMGWPKEYGGQGARPMEQAIVADEMARAAAPAPTNGLGLGIVGPTIVVHGNEWQKK